jgi:two-component system, OmpR family, KDP operon response regulator KdpE
MSDAVELPSRPPRVLVVDDDLANRTLTLAILGRATEPGLAGVTLRHAESLATARAALAAEPIDVVLLDVHLPDGLGLDLATELHEQADRPAIVALTASVLPADQQAALDSGCDAFLAKPYAGPDLIALVAGFLRDRA